MCSGAQTGVQYSKFDGFSSIKGMVEETKKHGMSACGLTDHGTFAGAIAFLKECRRENVRPVLGMEAYFTANHKARGKKEQPEGRKSNRHMNLIAKNMVGFQNICTLSQRASTEGFYYDPRVDLELLQQYSEGVIATSACLSNIINWNLSIDRYEHAKKAAGIFQDIFGEDFYMEVMYHGISKEGKILPDIQKIAKELNIKIIATNDCHYIKQEDAEYQQYVMCMSSGRCIRDPKRIKFPYDEFYFKSKEEMCKIFGHMPSSMSNTVELSEKCDYSDISFGQMKLPKFDIPADSKCSNPFEYLKLLAITGCKKLGLDKSQKHIQRLKTELSDIKLIYDTKKDDFASYFLMVEDIMRFAEKNEINCGIRGSGYGSVLCQCLRITEGVDPLEQDLLWERFMGFDDKYFLCDADFGING